MRRDDGLIGAHRLLAHTFGPDNIRVNAIEPDAVLNERQRRLWYDFPSR